jgi:hypothetical protein
MESPVPLGGRSSVLKAGAALLLLSGVGLSLPSLAEAQSRGTMQVSAIVVDSKVGFQSLDAAHAAVQNWAGSKTADSVSVATLAQVSLTVQPHQVGAAASAPTLVVSVEYLNN